MRVCFVWIGVLHNVFVFVLSQTLTKCGRDSYRVNASLNLDEIKHSLNLNPSNAFDVNSRKFVVTNRF